MWCPLQKLSLLMASQGFSGWRRRAHGPRAARFSDTHKHTRTVASGAKASRIRLPFSALLSQALWATQSQSWLEAGQGGGPTAARHKGSNPPEPDPLSVSPLTRPESWTSLPSNFPVLFALWLPWPLTQGPLTPNVHPREMTLFVFSVAG